jgi:hypothetical protein
MLVRKQVEILKRYAAAVREPRQDHKGHAMDILAIIPNITQEEKQFMDRERVPGPRVSNVGESKSGEGQEANRDESSQNHQTTLTKLQELRERNLRIRQTEFDQQEYQGEVMFDEYDKIYQQRRKLIAVDLRYDSPIYVDTTIVNPHSKSLVAYEAKSPKYSVVRRETEKISYHLKHKDIDKRECVPFAISLYGVIGKLGIDFIEHLVSTTKPEVTGLSMHSLKQLIITELQLTRIRGNNVLLVAGDRRVRSAGGARR